ncbi:sulfite exporter TauE/SafE family protein [Porphyromonas loveana]|uniref:sulfite exporter TauE/SafE family protein n=1 Tax=Porphyromonas loveana TaxID=1884669 RepID=UPI0035A0F0DC
MELLGYALAVLVGISLGLIGSGGSILTVPILVYVMAVEPVLATAYSLFVVGATALVGGIRNATEGKVDFRTAVVFGIPSIAAVYLTRAYLIPLIPDTLFSVGDFQLTKSVALMVLFAVVMMMASVSMIRPTKQGEDNESSATIRYNYPMILLEGSLVGILTGLVGAGGGFLIIPALVLLARMSMKLAVGTSLFIIAAKSLLGFLGDLQNREAIDWLLLSLFTAFSVVGIFIGSFLSKKIDGGKLKTAFGWFVLVMGVYILFKELFV